MFGSRLQTLIRERALLVGWGDIMSRKQDIYNEILRFSILQIRMYAGSNGTAPVWRHWRQNRSIERINCLCYLIHRIPLSLLDEEYTENDREFLDWGIPNCLSEMGEELMLPIRQGFVDFYDEAPEEWKPSLKWTPNFGLREQIQNQQADGEERS